MSVPYKGEQMSSAVRRQLIFIGVFLVVVLLFVTTFRMAVVHGQSMSPTYESGRVVLVRRQVGSAANLHHGDIVLLRKDRDVIIKRVFRLPGEEMDDSFPYPSEYVRRGGLADYYEQVPAGGSASDAIPPKLFVPKGFLVVIGDNLSVSEDSRIFGPVPVRDILGVVVGGPPAPYIGAPKPPSSRKIPTAPHSQ